MTEMIGAGHAAKLDFIRLSIDNATRTFFFREASTSDGKVIQQVLVQKCYDMRTFRQSAPLGAYYAKLIEGNAQPLLIDAGANIGASTLWFASNFPGSHVVAIATEKNNRDLLRTHLFGL